MGRDIFGTDGIRGPAYVWPLDNEGATQVGRAIAVEFADRGGSIRIGMDTRESSKMLAEAVATGITSQGVNAELLGVIPTPGLAYVTRESDAQAGVMITASHNPYTDNGIKVFTGDGTKLPDAIEAELSGRIDEQYTEINTGLITNNHALIESYTEFLFGTNQGTDVSDISLAIDCANGATSVVAPELFKRLHANVITLSTKPDGKNINDGCGATNTDLLQRTVIENACDIGLAFDGDGDRLIMVDKQGRSVNGDYIMYILARTRKANGVVATTMSNMGFENALNDINIPLLRTDVGDRYVVDGLVDSGYTIGGEQSGHVIMTDYYLTGDGLLTAIQVLKELKRSGKSLESWCDEVTILPQKIVNLQVVDKAVLKKPVVQDFILKKNAELQHHGRLIIRASGTEPLIRVMLESPDAERKVQAIAHELNDLITSFEKDTNDRR